MFDTNWLHICEGCGERFTGCKTARFCYDCRRKRVSESAKRRRLCDIGASARWRGQNGEQTVEGGGGEVPVLSEQH